MNKRRKPLMFYKIQNTGTSFDNWVHVFEEDVFNKGNFVDCGYVIRYDILCNTPKERQNVKNRGYCIWVASLTGKVEDILKEEKSDRTAYFVSRKEAAKRLRAEKDKIIEESFNKTHEKENTGGRAAFDFVWLQSNARKNKHNNSNP